MSMSTPPAPTTTPAATPAATAVASQVIPLAGGDPYNILSPNQASLFYLVTKGKEPGVYASWNNVGIQVLGVPGSIYRGVPSLAVGIALMNLAVAADQAAWIVV
ncbi:uncharacterized protein ARMOST_03177 [Armillaria ostoyae]|uniref:Ribonuclease H1 N-terminal domain-containing protein n=1 Tax=Armillaria ostoyae TaxID=47428 RepID=A0A284QTR7_ARMOS|nr:uncharacterized protein ARMOST_03177 [Armillaria ostoyae]